MKAFRSRRSGEGDPLVKIRAFLQQPYWGVDEAAVAGEDDAASMIGAAGVELLVEGAGAGGGEDDATASMITTRVLVEVRPVGSIAT